MKTKREVLKVIAKNGTCEGITCLNCPYENAKRCPITATIKRIGAMAILRQNRKKRGFDPNNVLTCVTADKAKVGTRGCFADNLATLREEFAQKNIYTLTRTFSEGICGRFEADNYLNWMLFYPIDEEVVR